MSLSTSRILFGVNNLKLDLVPGASQGLHSEMLAPDMRPRIERVIITIEGGSARVRWDRHSMSGGGHLQSDGSSIEVSGYHNIRQFRVTSIDATKLYITYEG